MNLTYYFDSFHKYNIKQMVDERKRKLEEIRRKKQQIQQMLKNESCSFRELDEF